MLKNYIKIAWRNILKNRFYSMVNITGLSVGIAFTLLIAAYVWGEFQVNRQLKNVDNQFIIQSKWKNANGGNPISTVGALPKALKESYPDLVANYYRYDGVTSNVSSGDRSFRQTIAIGDSTLISMYGFTLLHGNAATALSNPFTVVISPDVAVKYFGFTSVVGKSITIENFSGSKHDFLITGVLRDAERNTVTELNAANKFEMFVSTANLPFFDRQMNWEGAHIVGFVELQPGVYPRDLEKPVSYLLKQNAPERTASELQPYLVPLKEYYLSANDGLVKKMLFALSSIAVFILAMAVVNFINMSVSRSSSRMREIGIRKVLGGLKKQLILQFLIESIIIVLIATVAAFVIFACAGDAFGQLLNRRVPSIAAFPFYYIIYPVLFILFTGLTAGIYPAFVLSSLRSVDSLKGKLSVKENVWLRKGLVAFQFGTAAIALIGAVVISQQMDLFLNKDLGYNKQYVLSAQVPRNWTADGVNKMLSVRDRFRSNNSVESVSLAYEIPNGNNAGQAYIYPQGSGSHNAVPMQLLQSDENYLSVYSIPLAAGSFFDGKDSDSGKLILNETAVRDLGWKTPLEAIGKPVSFTDDDRIYLIKGVTKDFHFGSMQDKVPPVLFLNVQSTATYRFLSFRLKAGGITSAVSGLQKQWNELMPGAPFEYRFMEDILEKMYQSEKQLQKAAFTATALAVIIVLLGVIGLISLSIQKRRKEIGVRKVLGSSVLSIIAIFVREFLSVLLIGGLIACPVAFVVMNSWLQEYAYQVSITIAPFLYSIVALAVLTSLLICLQTLKAARANPVESLRSE